MKLLSGIAFIIAGLVFATSQGSLGATPGAEPFIVALPFALAGVAFHWLGENY